MTAQERTSERPSQSSTIKQVTDRDTGIGNWEAVYFNMSFIIIQSNRGVLKNIWVVVYNVGYASALSGKLAHSLDLHVLSKQKTKRNDRGGAKEV